MGNKHTKMEGSYLPETPNFERCKIRRIVERSQIETSFAGNQLEGPLDPRSPSGNRTPINTLTDKEEMDAPQVTENPLGALRRRIFKGFTYNLNDPRSPNAFLNRTPLVFDDANDKTFNMDDTFADLFVESNTIQPKTQLITAEIEQPSVNQQQETANVNEMQVDDHDMIDVDDVTAETEADAATGDKLVEDLIYCNEETQSCTTPLYKTEKQKPLHMDPRSPSLGVDRTPIIFSDDDEACEDDMMENILATLSLDLSTTSSLISMSSTPNSKSGANNDAEIKLTNVVKRPTNMHLERVRVGRSAANQRKIKRASQLDIYEDAENNYPLTPKQNKTSVTAIQRTPLSCVKNRTQMRSRSVDSKPKSAKIRHGLTNYDDTLYNAKVANPRILKTANESDL